MDISLRWIRRGGTIRQVYFVSLMSNSIPDVADLRIGDRYHRVELHDQYGGARYRGIAPSGDQPFVFLFTGSSGEEHGYKDEFQGDTFVYTGEGRTGDMGWSMGNKAIRDHKANSIELHLFENTDEAWMVSYMGQFECIGSFREPLPDTNGEMRSGIRFKLDPIDDKVAIDADDLGDVDIDELYKRASQPSSSGTGGETSRTIYPQSEVVRQYALHVADGVCQGCNEQAPFYTKNGAPYLEVHHLYRRSDGGPDHPDNVIAICPNCHRRAHHGQDGKKFNDSLIETVQ